MKVTFALAGAAAITLPALAAPVFLPRAEGPPPLREADRYLSNVERAVFNGPVEDVIAHLNSDEGSVLAFVQQTDRIAGIGDEIPIEGTFPDVGALRILELTDGSRVTERVVENTEARFAYQIWGFTAPAARPIDHIHGYFSYEARDEETTEVVWTYAVAPRVFWARPFIQGFLDNDFGPFMHSGLSGSAEAFNATVAN
ncbi:SRPBCC family protein [Gymnodinialimonas hymeniacidonis]|uniref:SRPBCC family protein n=1 Tax=Gymnodinialimonas hymeniacidonis TaxID=3126508 RepID=UPI0034C6C6A8